MGMDELADMTRDTMVTKSPELQAAEATLANQHLDRWVDRLGADDVELIREMLGIAASA